MPKYGRRELLQLAGIGGVVMSSALSGACATVGRKSAKEDEEFYFVQLSDTHWGFKGPPNPDADICLKQAVDVVNALPQQPDFVVFTGDLTQTTEDGSVRRQRMQQFKEIVRGLKAPEVRFMAGEHDASLDAGAAYQEFFGPLHYSFDHKGIHFAVLDNVSDPQAAIGKPQLDWLLSDLKPLPKDAPIVVFTHRPLFDLYPDWDWHTQDGADVMSLLLQWRNVTVFYGHIHQEHHHVTEHIQHHAAKSLIFPMPAPGSQPNHKPLPWDPTHPARGLGVRLVDTGEYGRGYRLIEKPLRGEG